MYVDTKLHAPQSPYRTRQELFNNAYWGIASQDWKRAWDDDIEQCKYFVTEKFRCAIGWNIPAPMYKAAMEGLTCTAPGIMRAARIHPRDDAFARALQDAHDDITPRHRDMRTRLEMFASDWGLKHPTFHAVFVDAE